MAFVMTVGILQHHSTFYFTDLMNTMFIHLASTVKMFRKGANAVLGTRHSYYTV